MARSDPNAQIIRGVLQSVSMQYKNPNASFVANEVFPTITGLTRKTKVAKYNKGPWFRDNARPRARGANGVYSNFGFNYINVDPVNYQSGYKIPIEDLEDERNEELSFANSIQDGIEFNANALDIRFELEAAGVLHAAAWSGQAAGGVDAEGHWGDATAGSDTFLVDISTGRTAIRASTGILPNRLFLTYEAFDKLTYSPALAALIYPTGYKGDVFVSAEALARLAKVEKVIIGPAVYNTDPETVADADADVTNVSIWGSPAAPAKGVGFLYYKPAAPGRKVPSAGYSYKVKKMLNNSVRLSTKWWDPAVKSWMTDTEEERETVPVGLDLGYLWRDTALT